MRRGLSIRTDELLRQPMLCRHLGRNPLGRRYRGSIRAAITAFLLLVTTSRFAGAQQLPAVAIGTRVQLTFDQRPYRAVGDFIDLGAGTVRIRTCSRCSPAAFSLLNLQSVARSQGRSVDRRRLIIGLTLGAAAGVAIGTIHGGRSDARCPPDGAFCGVATVVEPIGGGVIGALVGMVPAFAFPRERWETLWSRR